MDAAQALARGERPVREGAVAPPPLRTRGTGLLDDVTGRELEVLAYLAAGHDNHRIAAELRISVRTVKAHVSSLYRKLGAGNRTQLALEAQRRGVRPRAVGVA